MQILKTKAMMAQHQDDNHSHFDPSKLQKMNMYLFTVLRTESFYLPAVLHVVFHLSAQDSQFAVPLLRVVLIQTIRGSFPVSLNSVH